RSRLPERRSRTARYRDPGLDRVFVARARPILSPGSQGTPLLSNFTVAVRREEPRRLTSYAAHDRPGGPLVLSPVAARHARRSASPAGTILRRGGRPTGWRHEAPPTPARRLTPRRSGTGRRAAWRAAGGRWRPARAARRAAGPTVAAAPASGAAAA